MPRPLSLVFVLPARVLVPALALWLVPASSVQAGNQHGPGWQQHQPKKTQPAPASLRDAKAKAGQKANKSTKAAQGAKGVPGPAGGAVLPVAPRRTVPDAASIPRRIPGKAPLYEDELIRLAIANDPELARRRAEILISRAKERGAGDWENPELRIGYAWDHDDRIREPFIERATERIASSERYSSVENERNLATGFEPFAGDSRSQSSSGTIRTSRYRTIERRVTPGRYKDVIDTTISEHRKANETFGQSTTNTEQGFSANTREAGSKNTDRRIVERSREIIRHPDDYSRDDQLSILVRFQVPNPWERRANIELAAAQTARAESDYLIEEDKVVRTVRAMYEDLNMAESQSRAALSRNGINEKFLSELDAANLPGLADLSADVRLGIGKTKRDFREIRSDISRLREELSTYCGLDQPERIGVIGKPTRRIVPSVALDEGYLVSMAQLHRSDLLDLEARLAVAQAELKVARTAKIPFVTFVDGGWATASTTGRTGEAEEWSVRAGITLPIFDWFGINKAHLEHRAATEEWSRQIEEQRELITTEIRGALKRIRAAAAELGTYEKDLARVKADSIKSRQQTAVDPIRSLKTKYQTEELVFKFEEDRYEVWSDYYKAVMELERALGTRLERVLNR